jgi:hypothetical protein
MATTKKTGKTTRTKRKTTATRTAGKTARKATGTRVTAKSMAADILARDKRRPGFLDAVRTALTAGWEKQHTRVAQVMPREQAAPH